MKQDFLQYIQENFDFSPEEFQEFQDTLSKPLKKTIRVNTNKISVKDFQTLAEKNWWKLSPTPLGKNMLYIDRDDTTIALGNTLEHIAGYFYVQELAASSSPFYMSGDEIDSSCYRILDMSASPWGKTTQLAEYYPQSTIIANELDKSRMRQLHENIDRMWVKNVFVTNYDWRYFSNFPESFDKILLDTPCSGEGTAYKNSDALKYWNIKNINRIAKLQYQLLESAYMALKPWGELVYSTCTLNRIENEEVIKKLCDRYGDHLCVISLNPFKAKKGGKKQEEDPHIIRSWPHKNAAWWFFVAKLIKKSSLSNGGGESERKFKKKQSFWKVSQWFEKLAKRSEKIMQSFLTANFGLSLKGRFYTYRNEVYYSEIFPDTFWENFFFFQCGVKIGRIENGVFEPNFFLWTHFCIFQKRSIAVSSTELHTLFCGGEIPLSLFEKNKYIWSHEWYFQIVYENIPAGIVRIKNRVIKSLLETRFMKK